MTADDARPSDRPLVETMPEADAAATNGTNPATSRPVTALTSTDAVDHSLFRKRPDAIGPAPIYFSVALGIFFGTSVGFLVGYPIIGIVFGALLGALYAMIRRANHHG